MVEFLKPYMSILQKLKKRPDGFFTHLFFASAIILIFGALILHRLSRLLKYNRNLIRLPKLSLQDKNVEPGEITQIQSIPVGRQERSLPKATPKIDTFF